MTAKGQMLQDPFLNALRKEHVPVSIYLVNGIKLQGQVESFDQYVVLLRNTSVTQMVYKHAISTIVPARAVSLQHENKPQAVTSPFLALFTAAAAAGLALTLLPFTTTLGCPGTRIRNEFTLVVRSKSKSLNATESSPTKIF